MRKLILLSIALIVSVQVFGESFSQTDIIAIINTFKTKNKYQIALIIKFPIRRNYPLAYLTDADQFINEFDTVLDESTIDKICNSDPKKDWWEVEWGGLSIFDGLIWVDYDLKIIAINNETEVGTRIKQELIEKDRLSLPYHLRNYDYPLLKWVTNNRIIRVDVDKTSYRLIVYDKNSNIIKVLHDGKIRYDGNGGNFMIDFMDGDIVHRVSNDVFSDSTYSTFYIYTSEDEQISNPITEELKIE